MMTKPPVSDHALIRYLERVLNIDVERHRRLISAKVARGVELGASGVIVDGYCYKLLQGRVITVVEANRPDLRTGRVRRERAE